ncbi:hypothetical protein NDU88_003245 [Pleurodeles waltl]|uniref:Uncharacterized protein n=1 Tax=Pleurodeles waltl TaxID=8319 RepID=A0AAV7SEX9_PLEWA|nr:hypothetical protein NDU88_003245 [Pleurodeles waltl]
MPESNNQTCCVVPASENEINAYGEQSGCRKFNYSTHNSKCFTSVERLQAGVSEASADTTKQGFARTADLHRDLGIEMLDDDLRKLNVKFDKGLDQKENPPIKKLADISTNPFDRYPWPITALTM